MSAWDTPERARTSQVAYRLCLLAPLLSHCLKGLQLSDSLAQLVVFTLVVQSGFPLEAKISVAGVDCSPPFWGGLSPWSCSLRSHNLLYLRVPHPLEGATQKQSLFCKVLHFAGAIIALQVFPLFAAFEVNEAYINGGQMRATGGQWQCMEMLSLSLPLQ